MAGLDRSQTGIDGTLATSGLWPIQSNCRLRLGWGLRIRFLRDGSCIFDGDFDNYIIAPATHYEAMQVNDPVPTELAVPKSQ